MAKGNEKRTKKTPAAPQETRSETAADYEWFKDRMGDLGISHPRASEALGVGYHQIWRMISGGRTMKPHEIAAWAKLLKVSPSKILEKLGVDVFETPCPVVGTVRENGRISPANGSRAAVAVSPVQSGPELVAAVLEAPQGDLAAGAVIYFEKSDVVRPDAFGRLSVLEAGDSPAPLLGVLDKAAGFGAARIILAGGAEIFETSQLMSASPVRWIQCG